jgi:beta-lactamase superfamily II metal-dependent hydrolase
MFMIEMLPAQRGDALWITYGDRSKPHHVLIDGGPSETIVTLVPQLEARIKNLPGRDNRLELMVVTHVDTDHIQGAVSLLSDPKRVRVFRDVWFNAYEHLRPTLGAWDGERLTKVLSHDRSRWNKAFDNGPVAAPEDGELPVVNLKGGLELTLLSPTPEGLAKLAPDWKEECRKHGLVPGQGAEIPSAWRRPELLGFDIDRLATARYRRDTSKPNLTSIAFIARYDGASVLCAADAHAEVLLDGLGKLGPGPHEFTAVKVSHHGSSANNSPRLLDSIRSKNWLVSTNGAKFKHPHAPALARVITSQERPTFHLNYVTEHVQDLIDGAGLRYKVRLPRTRRDGTHEEGLALRLA